MSKMVKVVCCIVMDGNQIYCVDHFIVYTNSKLSCCIPEINIVLYVSFTSKKKNTQQVKLSILDSGDTELSFQSKNFFTEGILFM